MLIYYCADLHVPAIACDSSVCGVHGASGKRQPPGTAARIAPVSGQSGAVGDLCRFAWEPFARSSCGVGPGGESSKQTVNVACGQWPRSFVVHHLNVPMALEALAAGFRHQVAVQSERGMSVGRARVDQGGVEHNTPTDRDAQAHVQSLGATWRTVRIRPQVYGV